MYTSETKIRVNYSQADQMGYVFFGNYPIIGARSVRLCPFHQQPRKSSDLACNLIGKMAPFSGLLAEKFQAHSKDRNFRLRTRNPEPETQNPRTGVSKEGIDNLAKRSHERQRIKKGKHNINQSNAGKKEKIFMLNSY